MKARKIPGLQPLSLWKKLQILAMALQLFLEATMENSVEIP